MTPVAVIKSKAFPKKDRKDHAQRKRIFTFVVSNVYDVVFRDMATSTKLLK